MNKYKNPCAMLKFYSTVDENFKELIIETSFLFALSSNHALLILNMFGSTYLNQIAFLLFVAIKTRQRNKLRVQGTYVVHLLELNLALKIV